MSALLRTQWEAAGHGGPIPRDLWIEVAGRSCPSRLRPKIGLAQRGPSRTTNSLGGTGALGRGPGRRYLRHNYLASLEPIAQDDLRRQVLSLCPAPMRLLASGERCRSRPRRLALPGAMTQSVVDSRKGLTSPAPTLTSPGRRRATDESAGLSTAVDDGLLLAFRDAYRLWPLGENVADGGALPSVAHRARSYASASRHPTPPTAAHRIGRRTT